jgi:glycosyltransferase involved in cell wall biosynthesis
MTLENLKNKKLHGGQRLKRTSTKSTDQELLITIITSVLNGEKHLEETILSIINQTYKNIEYIIVDGGSTDGTIDIIKKYEEHINYWSSEKDMGIYYGFNRGLAQTNGDMIGFVNSDDVLHEEAISTLVKYYNDYPKIDFIFGSVKKHWGILHGYKPWKIFFSWGFYTSHSTGFFIKKEAAKKVGLYNTEFKYSSDYDYFYRMIVKKKLKGIATKKNEIFGTFRRGGFSSTTKFIDHFMETIKIRLHNKQNKLIVLMIFILKYLKNLKRL